MLRNCIFGEATLNDALSIVLFNVIRTHFDKLGHRESLSAQATDVLLDTDAMLETARFIAGAVSAPISSSSNHEEKETP